MSMRFVRSHVGLAALAAGLVLGAGFNAASASEKGKQLYVKHGCWQCHGFVGQGGIAGPRIAPDPMPAEAMLNFVRSSNRAMPPYSPQMMSDADFKEIHAYLVSIPKAPDPKSIPLLNQ